MSGQGDHFRIGEAHVLCTLHDGQGKRLGAVRRSRSEYGVYRGETLVARCETYAMARGALASLVPAQDHFAEKRALHPTVSCIP